LKGLQVNNSPVSGSTVGIYFLIGHLQRNKKSLLRKD